MNPAAHTRIHSAGFAVRALTACVLGLAVCPFFFIAIGALSHFRPMFSVVVLPLFLGGCGLLLFRYLAGPRDASGARALWLVVEGLSWLLVGSFLFLVSGINLATTFERMGAACTAFLLASVFCLPIVLVRRTALERRLGRLAPGAVFVLLLLIVVVSSLIVLVYLKRPAAFV